MSDKKDMSDMTASEISYRKFLKNLGVTTHKEIEKQINKIEKTIYKSVGYEFNINSTLQLRDILFDKLKLKPFKKTKKGIKNANISVTLFKKITPPALIPNCL